ncbi:ABC transporter permease [Macrococcus equipercicus]|uniref:Transport permease protein n=1 Tax=Macrococcus equipercicus TaxID=69967 RepID=A0A9Q9BWA9_9STAP|nr:ABC transporter permease [Macrococcus equipercicus]KAA1042630.1 ABC transporter permease [Macrococcus equipercicus]UTH14492.1 ABC transporter permease [Macrococcus equipercicus]
MKEVWLILKEQFENMHMIRKLAIYNMKTEYSNHYLGMFWNILQPLFQVLIYYVVFGMGMRQGGTGMTYLLHLISGLFPWLFISQSLNIGANAIYAQLGLVTKMKFPSSVLLSISFTNTFINLLFTTAIVVAMSLINGYRGYIHFFEFIYFIVAAFALIFAINLVMSTLVILVRDTRLILQNVLRMGFFVTPIFWNVHTASPILQKIASLNPFAFLIGMYRNAFIEGSAPVYGHLGDHLYFWSITLLLLFIGSHIHYRFKNRLIDFL